MNEALLEAASTVGRFWRDVRGASGTRQARQAWGLLALLVGAPACAVAEATDTARAPIDRGLALNVHVPFVSTWAYSYDYGDPSNPGYRIAVPVGHGFGLGLELSYGISPLVSAYVGGDLAGSGLFESGDSWVSYGTGVQLHWPRAHLVRPYASAGIGRRVIISSQGANTSMANSFAALGVGVELYASRRLALEYAVRFTMPSGHGTGRSPSWTPARIDEAPQVHRLGTTIHFGS